jgi:hypothetical protein
MGVVGLLGLALTGGARSHQQSDSADVDLDHVILGVSRLDRGIEEFARVTGVSPKRGGQHPGRGTENALVSLGAGHYLELLAPLVTAPDSSPAGPSALKLVGWALHTRALPGVVARIQAAGLRVSGPTLGSRRTPDGALLEWRTAAASGAGLESAPFFIEWGAGTAHPSTTSPGGCRLVDFEVTLPEPARLQALFRAVGYGMVVREGTPGAMRVTLECPRGRVSFSA